MLICQVQERDPGWLLPHVRARTVEPRAGREEDEGSEATRAAPQQAVGGHEGLPQGPDHHQQIMSPRPFLLSSLFIALLNHLGSVFHTEPSTSLLISVYKII